MNRIKNYFTPLKRKLKTRNGVSIIFALLAFLVASMVSIVLVTAALTSVKGSNQTQKAMQTKLNIQSAAEFMKDEMNGVKYTKITQYKSKVAQTPTETWTDSVLKNEMVQIISEIKSGIGWDGTSYKSNVTTTITPSDSNMGKVTVTHVLEKPDEDTSSYKIKYTLKTEDDTTSIITFDVTYSIDRKDQSGTVINPDGTGQITESNYTETETYEWKFDTIKNYVKDSNND